jgi:hypothetical protein
VLLGVMTDPLTDVPAVKLVDAGAPSDGRRRSGRTAVNPVLIPLLRGTGGSKGASPERAISDRLLAESEFTDDVGNPGRGIVFGLLLSIPLWIVIAAIIYWIF